MVELSSKFGAASGEAVELIEAAHRAGLTVEGLSFHVGSQCTNFENYVQALNLSAGIFEGGQQRGFKMKLLDIGGGFPPPTTARPPVQGTGPMHQRRIPPPVPEDIEILAEPGRFLVATAATLVAKVIGKADRDGKPCYYIDDGVYHTFSGIISTTASTPQGFKKGPTQISSVSARPATRWTPSRWPRNCPTWSWATWSTARTSAPTATPRPPSSTASPRQKCCILMNKGR